MCFVPSHNHLKDINLFINMIFIVSCVHLSIIYISVCFQYFANRLREAIGKFLINILVFFFKEYTFRCLQGLAKVVLIVFQCQ